MSLKISIIENTTSTSSSFFENSTFVNQTTFKFDLDFWISDVVICSFFAVASLYLLIALLYFYLKKIKRLIGQDFLSSEWKYRVLSTYICISIGFVSMFRHVYSIASLTLVGLVTFHNLSMSETTADVMCDVLPRFDVITQGISIALVMLFLWFRQRTFYVHSYIKIKFYKVCKFFSYVVLIMCIILGIYSLIIYMIEVHYRYFAGYCLTEIVWDQVSLIVFYPVLYSLAALQSFLLILFIFPIFSLRSQRSHETQHKKEIARLSRKAHRAMILTSICLLTDGASQLVFVTYYRRYLVFGFFPYNINLVVNHLVTIACFDCWKTMLWPWKTDTHKKSPSDEELYPMTVFPSDNRRTITDPGAHTSIREIKSSAFG